MAYVAERLTFEEASSDWALLQRTLRNDSVFFTLPWQKWWWELFGQGDLHLCRVTLDRQVIGIAPLMYRDNIWRFLGGTDLFDYHECLVLEGHEVAFFETVLHYIESEPWSEIEFVSLRDDAVTLSVLPDIATTAGYRTVIEKEDVSPGILLPVDWDAYLATLTKKNRHELRRKLRRLDTSGVRVAFRGLSDRTEIEGSLPEFFRMMRISRDDKTEFLTDERQHFFESLAEKLSSLGAIKVFFLDVDETPAAAVVCFDYKGIRFLYNSGYDPEFSHLSVSLMLKSWCVRNAIEEGIGYFDFLRGSERYKYDLGGVDHEIMCLRISRE
tara:strand:- start:558 stop:1538 length:981 start_codon:yes stop_codon:yes gene_type:complete